MTTLGLMPERIGRETFTVAFADCVLSAWLTADTVNVPPAGTVAGATYNPELDIVPTEAFPPGMLLTRQVTEVLVLPVTVAVNCCVPPGVKTVLGGLTETVTEAMGGEDKSLPPPPQPVMSGNRLAAATSRRVLTVEQRRVSGRTMPRAHGETPLILAGCY